MAGSLATTPGRVWALNRHRALVSAHVSGSVVQRNAGAAQGAAELRCEGRSTSRVCTRSPTETLGNRMTRGNVGGNTSAATSRSPDPSCPPGGRLCPAATRSASHVQRVDSGLRPPCRSSAGGRASTARGHIDWHGLQSSRSVPEEPAPAWTSHSLAGSENVPVSATVVGGMKRDVQNELTE